MRWTIGKKLLVGFGLALAILIIIGTISYRNMTSLLETADLVTHTHEVLTKLESVISLMKDVETGQRGYLLTGETRYLEPYYLAISNVERIYKEVKGLTRDNPVQQRRLDTVLPLIETKLAELRETIELRKGVGFEAALEVVLTNRGKTIMDDIRVVIRAMKEEERTLLADRSVAAQANARTTQWGILVITFCAFVLLFVVSVAISRSITRRISEIAVVANSIAQGDAAQTIPLHTTQDEITDLASAFNLMTAKRQQAQEELQESEQRFRLMVSEVKDYAIFMLDPRGRVTSWNQGAQHINGYASEEILGEHFSRFFPTEENEAGRPGKGLRVAVLEGRFEDEGWLVRKNGTQFIANVVITALRDHDGVLVGYSNVTRDITVREEKEAERVNLEVHLRQQQKLQAIGTLASGVAHEINNPINRIMNHAQLLTERLDPESPLQDYASEISRETERVALILRNLLSFSRQDRESHSPANLQDIIQNTVSLVQTVFRRDQISMEVDISDGLPLLKCRTQQIQQVLMNLLTNARDALNERYPDHDPNKIMSITVRTFEKEGRLCLRTTVEDHGDGIPDEIRQRVFDPFFTTKDLTKGTGLGLSISHGIVKEHHGELRIECKMGRYTRFHLELPIDNGWDLN